MTAEWIVYLILFAIGAPANILVLWKLLHDGSYKKSRHHFLLLNLSIADAIVVFIMIPVEIGWKFTVAWLAGDLLCKISKFFAAFGTYASSLLLISVSVDRYYAVVRPFRYAFLDRKMNLLLLGIWLFCFLISTPQIVIFSVERHPRDESFTQCVHFDYHQKWLEKGYTLANLFFLYGLPLTVIITCYSTISYIMIKRSRTQIGRAVSMTLVTEAGNASCVKTTIHNDQKSEAECVTPFVHNFDAEVTTCVIIDAEENDNVPDAGEVVEERHFEDVQEEKPPELPVRESNLSSSHARASASLQSSSRRPHSCDHKRSTHSRDLMKKRVLNQTLIIIGAFFVCWTPYVFITTWYVIDPKSAKSLSSSYNSYLFMFAVSNSVFNPFVYTYNLR